VSLSLQEAGGNLLVNRIVLRQIGRVISSPSVQSVAEWLQSQTLSHIHASRGLRLAWFLRFFSILFCD
jgi:hypothetical protein